VRARHFVLAAGGIGSAHLLLTSRSARHPQGLANGSGLVGRNLMFHNFAFVFFDLPERSYGALGSAGMVSVDDWHPSDASRGFIRGALVGESAEPSPIWSAHKASAYLGEGNRAWGKPLKDYLRRYPYLAGLIAIGEDLPRHDNQIDLDPTHADPLGIALPRITYESHPNDLAMHRYFDARLHELAGAAGATKSWSFDTTHSKGGTGHIMGTSRMGDDASTSVVDKWCRSHEVSNLYVPDGGCFPSSGGYNPTLTIFANAARAADHFLISIKRKDLS
jgi:choline dehydrogenase-like flavoprotein